MYTCRRVARRLLLTTLINGQGLSEAGSIWEHCALISNLKINDYSVTSVLAKARKRGAAPLYDD